MMVQHVLYPSPRADRVRVTVYELRNNDWFRRGTGFCLTTFTRSEDEPENPRILVLAEDDLDNFLLNTKIQKEDEYQRQKDTLILWQERESGLNMSLSFEDAKGCDTIWFELLPSFPLPSMRTDTL
ncbi:hypothetical protein GGI43DRAFT_287451 [Trichoderma evansii]